MSGIAGSEQPGSYGLYTEAEKNASDADQYKRCSRISGKLAEVGLASLHYLEQIDTGDRLHLKVVLSAWGVVVDEYKHSYCRLRISKMVYPRAALLNQVKGKSMIFLYDYGIESWIKRI